jgi:hypothetical protein
MPSFYHPVPELLQGMAISRDGVIPEVSADDLFGGSKAWSSPPSPRDWLSLPRDRFRRRRGSAHSRCRHEAARPLGRRFALSQCRSAKAAWISKVSTIRGAPIRAIRPPAILCSSTSRSSRTMRRPHDVPHATPAPRRSAESTRWRFPVCWRGDRSQVPRSRRSSALIPPIPAGAPDWKGTGIMESDHSAISVSDVAASDASMRVTGSARQRRGRADEPFHKPAHVEMLGYRHPVGRAPHPLAPNDLAATRIVMPTS